MRSALMMGPCLPFPPISVPSSSTPSTTCQHPPTTTTFFSTQQGSGTNRPNIRDPPATTSCSKAPLSPLGRPRVMSFIEKSVARLDQEEKLEHLAMELGRSHFWYKAPPKYYECIGTQFIQAVHPILKEAWSQEVEKAWQGLFQYLVATMRRGFCAEEKTVWGDPSLHSRKAGSESQPDWRE